MDTFTSFRWLERLALILVLMSSAPLAAAQTPAVAAGNAVPVSTFSSAVNEEARRFAQQTVRVERRRNDSVLNGAAIGAGTAVVSGLLFCRMMEPWEVCNDPGPLVRIGAVGAGIGIAIDALIRERETVYAPAASTQVYVAPVARRGAKGLQVAVRF